MQKHQFEEITASLSIIITLMAYGFEINWLFYIFLCKSIFDIWCALKTSYISAQKDIKKEIEKDLTNKT